ncbi:MAG: A/G-specific adenine glycosylase [Bryobacteraceae bacterium]
MNAASIRRKLTRWYHTVKRDLPWRRTGDPYTIWISEIMLQQTRVAAVIPYFERFLNHLPNVAALAAVPEDTLLALWSGLGYYSRARNLQKAAKEIVARGGFPQEHAELLQLSGIGDYTAAAVASIAFGRPHAAVDGNVRRVIARLTNDADTDVQIVADQLLDRKDPGAWNQAMMELGATVCIPREPLCDACPLRNDCAARRAGTQSELPGKKKKPDVVRLEKTLLILRRGETILLVPSPRVSGFWDLPEPFPGAASGAELGHFGHQITNKRYRFRVQEAKARKIPHGAQWFTLETLQEIPLGTTARKALRLYQEHYTPR